MASVSHLSRGANLRISRALNTPPAFPMKHSSMLFRIPSQTPYWYLGFILFIGPVVICLANTLFSKRDKLFLYRLLAVQPLKCPSCFPVNNVVIIFTSFELPIWILTHLCARMNWFVELLLFPPYTRVVAADILILLRHNLGVVVEVVEVHQHLSREPNALNFVCRKTCLLSRLSAPSLSFALWASIGPPTAFRRNGPSVSWVSLLGPTGVMTHPG